MNVKQDSSQTQLLALPIDKRCCTATYLLRRRGHSEHPKESIFQSKLLSPKKPVLINSKFWTPKESVFQSKPLSPKKPVLISSNFWTPKESVFQI